MNKYILASLPFLLLHLTANAQTFRVTGGNTTPFVHIPDAMTGLQQVVVLNGLEGVELSFTTTTQNSLKWQSYTERAVDSTSEEGRQTGSTTVLTSPLRSNRGYMVEDGGRNYFVWIIDYSDYPCIISDFGIDYTLSDCDVKVLTMKRNSQPMVYNSINGGRYTLAREFTLRYNALEWDGESKQFIKKAKEEIKKGEFNEVLAEAPLCDTDFTLIGDQFAIAFGLDHIYKSDILKETSVKVYSSYEILNATEENPKLEGSAPMEVLFTAYGNMPACEHYAWEYAAEPTFENKIATYIGEEAKIHFDKSGKYYVRVIGSSLPGATTGQCSSVSESYEVVIYDSEIKVPNAFSPNASPGINDTFKPKCKSIVRFEAWVFNKWGAQIFHWTDPYGEWDGKHNGKFVLPGPYFYVIEAEGSDGKKYLLKGDINIVGGNDKTNNGNDEVTQ